MRTAIFALALGSSFLLEAALPAVTIGEISQDDTTKRISIAYSLGEGDDCIVTIDAKKGGEPIGGERLATLWGDVNKKIAAGGDKVIYWNPASAGYKVNGDEIKFEIKLWPTNSPPNYMVLDLSGRREHRFYPEKEQIPLGVTNDVYKTDYLVMRKIPAAGVTWRMGAGAYESPLSSDNTLHLVTLKEDYYLAIYEMTIGQMLTIGHKSVVKDWSQFKDRENANVLPIDGTSWYNIRFSSDWPQQGHVFGQYTYFKALRNKVGDILFDLPTEAQWEYACRAGTKTKYHNGDNYGLDSLGWYNANCTNALTNAAEPHPVGMKDANAWGLFDMLGNMREWCLDYYRKDYGLGAEDYDDENFNGPTSPDSGLSQYSNERVLRGGSFKNNSLDVKSAARSWGPASSTRNIDIGFRLWCPAVYPL